MRLSRLLALPLTLLFTPLFADGPDIKEGSWHINSTTEMHGMPMGDTTMPYESVQCLTMENMIPAGQDSQCTISDEKITGSSINWKIQCPTGHGEGTVRYTHKTFNGVTTMWVTTPMGELEVITQMFGQYQGPCQ